VRYEHNTVDGVPVCWTGAGGGRLSAGLVFRVGRADETLVTSGITHLLEHLVLFPIERADLHVNGVTSPGTTTFRLDDAEPEELAGFLEAVCAGLREPPVERLEAEKAILRTEANRRDAANDLSLWRYGPAGFGLPSFEEYGLDRLTAQDVREWAATRFNSGNAALWISGGPPPEGLRLDLPAGGRMPYPPAVEVLPRLPAYFNSPVNGAVFDLVVPRSRAAMLYAAVLDRRLFARLRRELGVSYTAAAHYQPRDAGHAVVTAMADALPEHRVDMCRAVVDILLDLSREPPSGAELATARTLVERAASPAASAEAVLAGVLEDGAPEEAEEDLRAVARTALDSALAMLPERCAIGRAGFVRAPGGSAAAVEGTVCKPVNRPDATAELIVGPEGVSLRDGLLVSTVYFAQCRGMLAWPDGARRLFGADAVTVLVEPTMWHLPAAELARIDAAVPAALTVAQPAREPGRIPQAPAPPPPKPRPEPAARPPSTASRRRRRRWLVGGAYLFVVAAVLVSPFPKAPLVVFTTVMFRVALSGVDRL
jgi:zinc protease